MLLLAGEFIYSNSTVEGKPVSPPTEIGLLVSLLGKIKWRNLSIEHHRF